MRVFPDYGMSEPVSPVAVDQRILPCKSNLTPAQGEAMGLRFKKSQALKGRTHSAARTRRTRMMKSTAASEIADDR